MKPYILKTLVIGSFLLACTSSQAQEENKREKSVLSIGGRAMVFHAEDSENTDFFGGVQLRVYLSNYIAVEGSTDYRRTKIAGSRLDVFPVQASLLAYLYSQPRFNFFILGGGGWYYTHFDAPSNMAGVDRTQNRFGPHAGAGVQVFLNRRWSVDGSFRYAWVEDVESRATQPDLLNKDYEDRGLMGTAGVNFHF